ncbi:MAG: PIN domain-containing protein [Pirellulales bacterium]
MQYLVDTGVWLCAFDGADDRYEAIREAFRRLNAAHHSLVLARQNVAEFWNVSTRTNLARGGYGKPPEIVFRRLAWIERHATIVPDPPAAYQQWKLLLHQFGIIGVASHDARLVATMACLGIRRILTLNGKDFVRYRTLTVVTPEDIAAGKL